MLGPGRQPTDGDKSFGPQRSGVVLGMYFDLVAWQWRLEEENFRMYWYSIEELLSKKNAKLAEVKQVMGRIIYVASMMQ